MKHLLSEASGHTTSHPKLKVGVLGTGKIGTDLLYKILASEHLECVMFAGRNLQSEGMQIGQKLHVPCSDKGIAAFDDTLRCDLAFDATSAAYHIQHAKHFRENQITAVDMTPSQIGHCLVPAIGLHNASHFHNISMISCGGQSSIPVIHTIHKLSQNVKQVAVKSLVSPDSVGPGTWANIDEYYNNTRTGIFQYTGIKNIDIELCADVEHHQADMKNTIYCEVDHYDREEMVRELSLLETRMQEYVPGYTIKTFYLAEDFVEIVVTVRGKGDYLPEYAGNLDIINCAAIAVAEEIALQKYGSEEEVNVA